MKQYLGDRAKGRQRWHIPVLIFLGVMTLGSLMVLRDDLAEGKGDTWASVVLLALFAWGIFAILRAWRRNASVEKYARVLDSTPKENLPFDRLRSLTGVNNAERAIKKLLDAGYLKGFEVDFAKNAIIFGGGTESAPAPFVEIECPGCGAKNAIRAGRMGQCEFCGTKMVAKASKN